MVSSGHVIWWLLGGAVFMFVGIIPLSSNPAGPVVALAGFVSMLIGAWLFTQVKQEKGGERK
jgi:xanthosine utilization system XapX-like protein